MQRLIVAPDAPINAPANAAAALGWTAMVVPEAERGDVLADYAHASGVRARVVNDLQSGWLYLLVPNAHAAAWRDAMKQVSSKALVSREAALEKFRDARTSEDFCEAALLLGLFANGPLDDEIFAAISAALLSSSDMVKSAAMTAITYSTWSEFGPFLRTGLAEMGASVQMLSEGREIAEQMDNGNWNRAYYDSDP